MLKGHFFNELRVSFKVLKQMKINRSFMSKLKSSGPSSTMWNPSYHFFQAAKFIGDLNSLSSAFQVKLNARFEKSYAFSFASRRP